MKDKQEYSIENYPTFVKKRGELDIYRNQFGHCIAVKDGEIPVYFGNMHFLAMLEKQDRNAVDKPAK